MVTHAVSADSEEFELSHTGVEGHGCSGRPSEDMIVLSGHAFQPNVVFAAVTPFAAAADSTMPFPSADTVAVALYTTASLPMMEKPAHALASTLNSVWQWSSAATRLDGTCGGRGVMEG